MGISLSDGSSVLPDGLAAMPRSWQAALCRACSIDRDGTQEFGFFYIWYETASAPNPEPMTPI
jgi:hypothetical protein